MVEYPSIKNSSKAPRQNCIAFNKYDGSNFRAKWTAKKGFCLFGTRTQLIDESTPYWSVMVETFNNTLNDTLSKIFKDHKDFRYVREIVLFGEYFGLDSFAGQHIDNQEHSIIPFDILVGHKQSKFLLPQDFIKLLGDKVPIPEIVYEGNLTDQFILDVRENKFDLNEGVVCKGTQGRGDYSGGVWMAKIKTWDYLNKLKSRYGEKFNDYWE